MSLNVYYFCEVIFKSNLSSGFLKRKSFHVCWGRVTEFITKSKYHTEIIIKCCHILKVYIRCLLLKDFFLIRPVKIRRLKSSCLNWVIFFRSHFSSFSIYRSVWCSSPLPSTLCQPSFFRYKKELFRYFRYIIPVYLCVCVCVCQYYGSITKIP